MRIINPSLENNALVEKTIKAHLKHFKLKIKNGFVYKGEIAIYTNDLIDRIALLSFLEGISVVLDNKDLWGLE